MSSLGATRHRNVAVRPRLGFLGHAVAVGVALSLVVPAGGSTAAQPASPAQPLLSAADLALLLRVRDNVIKDDDVADGYAYTMERRTYDVSFGKVSDGDVKLYEVVASPFEPGRMWRRLVAINGVRLSPDQLARQEAKARSDAASAQRERDRETPAARARRVRDEQDRAAERRLRVLDVERVYQFERAGEERLDGRPTVVFDMRPRADAQTSSDVGKHLKKVRGRIWVDPAVGQLVRLAMETTEDISVGFGVIGRVSRGSRGEYRRAPITGDTWLPVEARFQGRGRTLLLLPFQIETWAKYFDYRPMVRSAARTSASPRQ